MTGAKRKRNTAKLPSRGAAAAATPSGADDQENVLNSAAAVASASIGGVLKRKKTRLARTTIASSGCARSALGPAPCSLKKMKTTGGVGPANSKSKRLFRARRRSVRSSR